MIRFLTAAAAVALFTSAAFAGTDMQFPVFTGISAHGGAKVILHHGNAQRVTIVKGDVSKADLHMSGNALDISPCKSWLSCWRTQTLEVEIVSPKIEAVEAHGGGSIKAAGEFPKLPSLNAEAHGGGAIDARAIPADTVNASAHGGGAIKVKALQNINAEAHGGGAISYAGNPPHVAVQSHGGGAIHRE
jgi:hypothetical protein